MANWFKKSQSWFKRHQHSQQSNARFTFDIAGDVFVDSTGSEETDKINAEERLKGFLSNEEGIRVNNFTVMPYEKIF